MTRVAAALVLIGLAMAAAEAGLRLLPSGLVVEADIYRMEDGLLLLRPHITRRHVTPLWDVTLRTNGAGFRDIEREPKPEETVAIALGDSLAFGWGVEQEQAYCSLLEAEAPLPVRLVQAAVPGTGTTDQARLLERLLGRYRPRVVVAGFFVGNDFVDVARGGSLQYQVVDGFLAHRGGPRDGLDLFREWAIRSRLLQLLRAAQFELGLTGERDRRWDAWMREYAEIHLAHPPERTEHAVRATLAALDDIAGQCERAGSALLLVALPRSFQTDPAELAETLEALNWRPDEVDMDRPQRLLAEWAAGRGVAFEDVLPAFRSHLEEGGPALFYTPDAHLTPEGHAQAARAIQPAFNELLQRNAY